MPIQKYIFPSFSSMLSDSKGGCFDADSILTYQESLNTQRNCSLYICIPHFPHDLSQKITYFKGTKINANHTFTFEIFSILPHCSVTSVKWFYEYRDLLPQLVYKFCIFVSITMGLDEIGTSLKLMLLRVWSQNHTCVWL